MTSFAPEMLEKAKAVKSAEELLSLAKENHIKMTEEEARIYFERLGSESSELSDDVLGNVAGGAILSRSSSI